MIIVQEEQYAVFMTKGVVVDKDGFPIGSNEAYVLGAGGNSKSSEASKAKVLDAAEKRRKQGINGTNQGHRLGGELVFQRIPKNPREAARMAAERRLRDDHKCIPCTEVIEILDDEESDDEIEIIEDTSKPRTRPRREEVVYDSDPDTKPKAKADESVDVIDLTGSPSVSREKMKSGSKRMANLNWTCPHCTLSNPALALTCGACYSERQTDKSTSERVKEMERQDKVDAIKEAEVRRSKEMFGGFDIYGSKKRPTSTLNHLT